MRSLRCNVICSAKPRKYVEGKAYCETLWMRVASVHSQAENDAIGQLIGPTGQDAFLGAERLDDMSWQWHDGTPWNFEAWQRGQPESFADQNFMTIEWQLGSGVDWRNTVDEEHGVACSAPSISAIRGDIPTGILQLGGPENSALIAASADL